MDQDKGTVEQIQKSQGAYVEARLVPLVTDIPGIFLTQVSDT